MKMYQLSWVPLPFRAVPWDFAKQIPEQAVFCLLEVHSSDLSIVLLSFLRIFNAKFSQSVQTKITSAFAFPGKFFLVCDNKLYRASSLGGSLITWVRYMF